MENTQTKSNGVRGRKPQVKFLLSKYLAKNGARLTYADLTAGVEALEAFRKPLTPVAQPEAVQAVVA